MIDVWQHIGSFGLGIVVKWPRSDFSIGARFRIRSCMMGKVHRSVALSFHEINNENDRSRQLRLAERRWPKVCHCKAQSCDLPNKNASWLIESRSRVVLRSSFRRLQLGSSFVSDATPADRKDQIGKVYVHACVKSRQDSVVKQPSLGRSAASASVRPSLRH